MWQCLHIVKERNSVAVLMHFVRCRAISYRCHPSHLHYHHHLWQIIWPFGDEWLLLTTTQADFDMIPNDHLIGWFRYNFDWSSFKLISRSLLGLYFRPLLRQLLLTTMLADINIIATDHYSGWFQNDNCDYISNQFQDDYCLPPYSLISIWLLFVIIYANFYIIATYYNTGWF